MPDPPWRQAFAAFLLAAASKDAAFVDICHHFGAFDEFRAERVPAFSRVSDWIKTSQPWTVADEDTGEALRTAREHVEQVLRTAFQSTSEKSRTNQFRESIERPGQRRLRMLWQAVQNAPDTSDADIGPLVDRCRSEIIQLVKRHEQVTFFRREALLELDAVLDKIHRYHQTRLRERVQPNRVGRASLHSDVTRLAGNASDLLRVYEFVERQFVSPPRQYPSRSPILALLLKSPRSPRLVPQLVAHICGAPRASLPQDALQQITEAIATPPSAREAIQVLKAGRCYHHLAELAKVDGEIASELPDAASQKTHEHNRLLSALESQNQDFAPGIRAELRGYLDDGCFACVDGTLTEAVSIRQIETEEESKAVNKGLSHKLARLRQFEDEVDLKPATEDWKAGTNKAIDRFTSICRAARGSQVPLAEKRRVDALLEEAVERLRRHIEFDGHDLEPLERLLEQTVSQERDGHAARAGLDLDVVRKAVEGSEGNTSDRVRLWQIAQRLAAVSEKEPDSALFQPIREFQLGLARLVRMYSEDGVSLQVLKIPGFPYHTCMSTAFRKPGAAHFERAIHLYTLVGPKPAIEAVRAQIELDASRAILHVVVVPGHAEEVRRRLGHQLRQGAVTIVDLPMIKDILESRSPWSPLRSAMRRAISLEVCSPFKHEGYVDENRDIFVGRREVKEKLRNGGCWVLWGARRSGKTSLLHAVRTDPPGPKVHPRRTRYLSLEDLDRTMSPREVDLEVARRIARALGWPREPANLDDFGVELLDDCSSHPTCLLFDEVDRYLTPHLAAAHTDFDIMRRLRKTRNELNDNFVCVFAGFRLLFRVTRLVRRADDPGYPWQNWLSVADPKGLCRLTFPETTELVREGFRDILGLEYEPQVPGLVYEYTAGHPALVQCFCHCVLRRLVSMGRENAPRITGQEVVNTYEEHLGRTDDDSFIRFVEHTLEMNLDQLARIVIYLMAAVMIGSGGDPEQEFPRHAITQVVHEWFRDCGRDNPSDQSLDEAFQYLGMTGMLKEKNPGSMGLAFPTYVQILVRLEQGDREKIARLIREYKG